MRLLLGLIAALIFTFLVLIAPISIAMVLGCTLLASALPYRRAALLGEA